MLSGERLTVDDVAAWFARRVPSQWFSGPLEVTLDREEILVLGPLASTEPLPPAPGRTASSRNRVTRFREETRDTRMAIAAEAEHIFGRKVSWGVIWGGERLVFSALAVPVMTRLRLGERAVLDTLIDAGVAKSRSEALAWCVRLVERHQAEWIAQLRQALVAVERARAAGPGEP
ncbi:MAG: hypothetical protein M3P53_09255 [Actinomycetota bacterium]|nr:hypothetical protein [Actinomycetota bacterium]